MRHSMHQSPADLKVHSKTHISFFIFFFGGEINTVASKKLSQLQINTLGYGNMSAINQGSYYVIVAVGVVCVTQEVKETLSSISKKQFQGQLKLLLQHKGRRVDNENVFKGNKKDIHNTHFSSFIILYAVITMLIRLLF